MLLSKSELVLESRLAVISTIEPSIRILMTAGPTRVGRPLRSLQRCDTCVPSRSCCLDNNNCKTILYLSL